MFFAKKNRCVRLHHKEEEEKEDGNLVFLGLQNDRR